MTGDSKKIVGFPPWVQEFLLYIIHITCTFKRTSLRLFRFKIHNLSPFWWNLQNLYKICIKGTNYEILNLNNRRLVRLKDAWYITKKSCTDGGNPTKKIYFWVTSRVLLDPHLTSFNVWIWQIPLTSTCLCFLCFTSGAFVPLGTASGSNLEENKA